MRKKIIITILLIIFIIQAIMPIRVNAEPTDNQTGTNTGQTETNPGTGNETTGDGMQSQIPTLTKPKTSIFNKDVRWEWEYVDGQYGLLVPSNADSIENAPMIVWLHGNGDALDGSEGSLKGEQIPKLFLNWNMEGFSAFILCPQSKASWQTPNSSKIISAIEKVIQEYPIDPNNVVIMGHSGGAVGALSMAVNHSEHFSKAVVMAGLSYSREAASIPTKCYVGTQDSTYVRYMATILEPLYGSENCFYMDGADHNSVNKAAFYEDNGKHFGIARK